MIYDLSRTERQHLAISKETTSTSLVVKRCACGKSTTAKQLSQHGKCVACALADRVATLHPGDVDKLKHTVGAQPHYKKSQWGFRNHYCAARGGKNEESMLRLVSAGFMTSGQSSVMQAYFHATVAGCKLAGLNAAGVRRAMED